VSFSFGMNTSRNLLAAIAAAGLVTVGCDQREIAGPGFQGAQLQKRLTGTWGDGSNGVLALRSDGSFSSSWTNWQAKPPAVWKYEGTWQLTNGLCYATIAKADALNTTNIETVGSRDAWRLIRVNDRELAWEFDGRTNHLDRLP
jgi:hypothetical protein